MRLLHENQLHSESCFITLTYAAENLPYGGTLIKKHFQDFAKRLRKRFHGRKIKYFHCGEYGEACAHCGLSRRRCRCPSFVVALGRPHYHAVLFGVTFDDQEHFKDSADGSAINTSETLQRLWPAGFVTVGAVTFKSAAYVARYCLKKINGKAKITPVRRTPNSLLLTPYERLSEDGEIITLQPEYTTMSLKGSAPGQPGGIAAEWYRRFKTDAYPSDFIVINGKKMKPPKYYDRLLELEDPEARAALRERRMAEALKRESDSTTARLLVREQVKIAQTRALKRGIE